MALSLRRANSVKAELVRQGVPADAVAVVGRGEANPLVATGDGVREPQNRRVEIVIDGGAMVSTTTVFSDPRSYCKALSDKWRQYRTSQLDTPEAGSDRQVRGRRLPRRYPDARERPDRQQDPAAGARLPLARPAHRTELSDRLQTLEKAARKGTLFFMLAQSSSRRSMNGL